MHTPNPVLSAFLPEEESWYRSYVEAAACEEWSEPDPEPPPAQAIGPARRVLSAVGLLLAGVLLILGATSCAQDYMVAAITCSATPRIVSATYRPADGTVELVADGCIEPSGQARFEFEADDVGDEAVSGDLATTCEEGDIGDAAVEFACSAVHAGVEMVSGECAWVRYSLVVDGDAVDEVWLGGLVVE